MAQDVKQVRVVAMDTPRPAYDFEPAAFFDEDGNPIELGGQAGPVAWNDVTGKPATFPPAAHTHAAGDVTGLAAVATSGSWNDVTGKPATFPPAAHTHAIADVTGLQAVIDDLTTDLAALTSAVADLESRVTALEGD